jgi:hypothetical protein
MRATRGDVEVMVGAIRLALITLLPAVLAVVLAVVVKREVPVKSYHQ